jgi:hypothetical protein
MSTIDQSTFLLTLARRWRTHIRIMSNALTQMLSTPTANVTAGCCANHPNAWKSDPSGELGAFGFMNRMG